MKISKPIFSFAAAIAAVVAVMTVSTTSKNNIQNVNRMPATQIYHMY